MRYERGKRNILDIGRHRCTSVRHVRGDGIVILGDIMSKFELTGSGKGDKRRPAQVSKREADLRWQLMLEKDEKKKAEIKKELEGLR